MIEPSRLQDLERRMTELALEINSLKEELAAIARESIDCNEFDRPWQPNPDSVQRN